jgi:predicted O-methyltransferase YrrM
MLKYLPGIKWVGKLSLEDADLLAEYGSKSASILEFGVGGSTLIFSQVSPNPIISVEEDDDWLALTKKRLDFLGTSEKVKLFKYGDPYKVPEVDLIFVDGLRTSRLGFAEKYWDKLKVGGYLMFHDTTRQKYLEDTLTFISNRPYKISNAIINAPASNGKFSNITIIKKGEPVINWKYEEDKPQWAYSEDLTVDFTKMWEYNIKTD